VVRVSRQSLQPTVCEELEGVKRNRTRFLGVALLKLLAMSQLALSLNEPADGSCAIASGERLFGSQNERVVLIATGRIGVAGPFRSVCDRPMQECD
jgi:hypothetical protein